MSTLAVGGPTAPISLPGQSPAASSSSGSSVASVTTTGKTSPVSGSQGQDQSQVSQQQAQQVASALQKALSPVTQDIEFAVDKTSGRTVIKVMDTSTNKEIRQIPSQEILDLAQSINTYQSGLLIKQKA